MNMNYYGYPYGTRITQPMPSVEPPFPSGMTITPQTPSGPNLNDPLSDPNIASIVNRTRREQSYIENILRLNRGKRARVFMTFPENSKAERNIFAGIIEGAGRDHILMRDPNSGENFLLLMVYLDYVDFPESINYVYPSAGIVNIIDEELYETDPYLAQLKEYKDLYDQYQATQTPPAAAAPAAQ